MHDNFEKGEKITMNFEPTDDRDVIHKSYLDEKVLKTNGHLSLLEKVYNEFKLQNNKQSVEEFLIQRAVKTTSQILFDKSLIDGFPNADDVFKKTFVCHKT